MRFLTVVVVSTIHGRPSRARDSAAAESRQSAFWRWGWGGRKQTVCYLSAAGVEPKADSLLSEGRQLVDCGGGRGKTAGRRPAGAEEAACGVAR